MYCGDETGAFIGEIGSHTSRFGYGGDDTPKYVTSSYVANNNKRPLSSCYQYHDEVSHALRMAEVESYDQPVVDPTKYLQQGDVVEDWDAYEHTWQHAFDVLHVREKFKHTKGGGDYRQEEISKKPQKIPGEGKCSHPLLAVTPGCTHIVGNSDNARHRKELVQFTEIMMEKMDCQALFLAPAPMLAAFAQGRQTALVVDVGASGCKVTPVVDGLLLKQAQRRNGRGGDWLGNVQWKALLQEKSVLRPRYLKDKPSKGIFHRWAMSDLMYEFRTSEHVKLPGWRYDPTVPFMQKDDEDTNMDTENTYELPDGSLVNLTTHTGRDLCRVPELLFTDELPFLPDGVDQSILDQSPTLSNLPLDKLIHESLGAVTDVDARKDLAGSILLSGGSSLFPALEQRLSLEVPRIVSGAYKAKILASSFDVERSCASWIGASVLSSLGSFQQLWLSNAEYEEYGASLAVQRFP